MSVYSVESGRGGSQNEQDAGRVSSRSIATTMLGPPIKARLCRDNHAAVEYVYARKTFVFKCQLCSLNRARPPSQAVARFADDGAMLGSLHPYFLAVKIDTTERFEIDSRVKQGSWVFELNS